MKALIVRFLRDERGSVDMDSAVTVSLLAIVGFVGLSAVGESVTTVMQDISDKLRPGGLTLVDVESRLDGQDR